MGYDMVSRRASTDQALLAALGEWDRSGDKLYFRLNIFGMGSVREVLLDAGAIDEADMDMPAGRWKKADLAKEMPSGKASVMKLGSNDGWIVTPAECKVIAERVPAWLDAHTSGDPSIDKAARQFAVFAGRCAKLGGFEVH